MASSSDFSGVVDGYRKERRSRRAHQSLLSECPITERKENRHARDFTDKRTTRSSKLIFSSTYYFSNLLKEVKARSDQTHLISQVPTCSWKTLYVNKSRGEANNCCGWIAKENCFWNGKSSRGMSCHLSSCPLLRDCQLPKQIELATAVGIPSACAPLRTKPLRPTFVPHSDFPLTRRTETIRKMETQFPGSTHFHQHQASSLETLWTKKFQRVSTKYVVCNLQTIFRRIDLKLIQGTQQQQHSLSMLEFGSNEHFAFPFRSLLGLEIVQDFVYRVDNSTLLNRKDEC